MKGGDGQSPRVAKREVGQARDARLVDVHDVEAIAGQRELEVRSHPDGNAEAAPAGDGDRGPERDRALQRRSFAAQSLQSAPPGRQVRRAARRREDNDLVPPGSELGGSARNMVVDRVRLRPRKRGDHADPEAHGSDSTVLLKDATGNGCVAAAVGRRVGRPVPPDAAWQRRPRQGEPSNGLLSGIAKEPAGAGPFAVEAFSGYALAGVFATLRE